MAQGTNQLYLVEEQYKSSTNLRARMVLYERFSTLKVDFSRWMFDHIKVPADAKVLELGAGPASLWVKNRERIPQGWHVTLTDLSPGMIEEAKRAVADVVGRFDFAVADAQALPFEDDAFNVVIANHMLYHVLDIDKTLREIRRVLKPGGQLYTTTNSEDHLSEMSAFIQEHLTSKLFPGSNSAAAHQRFQLEAAPAFLERYFDTVEMRLLSGSLEVTEAEPFMAAVLSWDWLRSPDRLVLQERVVEVVDEAYGALERQLVDGPFRITTLSGLLIASRSA